jgi:thioredoxin 1
MSTELTRGDVDAMVGATVLEFGATWCPICQAARPLIDRSLGDNPAVKHHWIEDGKGKALGRSFRVKLWPTLVFLRDGKEVARVVRPHHEKELAAALQHLAHPAETQGSRGD